MAKTKEDYTESAQKHIEKGFKGLKEKKPLPKGYFESEEFFKAAVDFAHAGMEKEAYGCLRRSEDLYLKASKQIGENVGKATGTKYNEKWDISPRKSLFKSMRKEVNDTLSEVKGEGLVDKVLRALRFRPKKFVAAVLVGAGLYLLFSKPSITRNVVTNLNSINSGFLTNFILAGVLGLVCYSYLR